MVCISGTESKQSGRASCLVTESSHPSFLQRCGARFFSNPTLLHRQNTDLHVPLILLAVGWLTPNESSLWLADPPHIEINRSRCISIGLYVHGVPIFGTHCLSQRKISLVVKIPSTTHFSFNVGVLIVSETLAISQVGEIKLPIPPT